MLSQPGHRAILMHILHNILKSKDNQTMKFSQIVEYNTRNISYEKSCTKCGGENYPQTHFLKIKIERISRSIG